MPRSGEHGQKITAKICPGGTKDTVKKGDPGKEQIVPRLETEWRFLIKNHFLYS